MPWGPWTPHTEIFGPRTIGVNVTHGVVVRTGADAFTDAYDATRAGDFDAVDNLITDLYEARKYTGGSVRHSSDDDGLLVARGDRTQVLWGVEFDTIADDWPRPLDSEVQQWQPGVDPTFDHWSGITDDLHEMDPQLSWPYGGLVGTGSTYWDIGPGTFRLAYLDWDIYAERVVSGYPAAWIADGAGVTIATATIAHNAADPVPMVVLTPAEFAMIPAPRLLLLAEWAMPALTGTPPVLDPGHSFVTIPVGAYPVPDALGVINTPDIRIYDPVLRTVGGLWGLPPGALRIYQPNAYGPPWPVVRRFPDA
jgi:hypothetical protein